jgi:hypothetical protein
MTGERDEILDELRAAVNVEPSPAFEARVRRATHEQHRAGTVWPGPRRAWLWSVVAGGAVAAAVIAVFLLRSGDTGSPSAVAMAQPQPTAADAPSRSVQPPPTAAVVRPAPLRRAVARRASNATTTVVRAGRREPDVLVPPDQAVALARLLEGVSEGRVMIGATKAMDADVTIAPLSDPTPVTITDVRIESLPVPAGGAS